MSKLREETIYRSLQELNALFIGGNLAKRKPPRPKMDEWVRVVGTTKKCQNVLSPLLGIMRMMGIVDRRRNYHDKIPKGICCNRNYVTLFIMYLYLVHYASISIVYGKLHSSARVLSGHISVILRILVIAVNVTIFTCQQNRLFKLTDNISRVIRNFNSAEIRTIRRKSRIAVIFLGSSMISLMISGVISDSKDLDGYVFNFFYGLNKTMNDRAVLTICVVDWSVFVMVDGMGGLVVTYFGFVCYLMRLKVRVLCTSTSYLAKQNEVTTREVGQLVKNYSELLILCKDADTLFNRVVFLWYGDVVNRFVYFIPIIVMSVLDPGEYTITAAVLNLFTNVIIFMTVSITASGISEDMEDGLTQLGTLAAKATVTNEPVYNQTVGFLVITNAFKLNLTGCNCFNLQKSIILTTFSIVISYIVVIVSVFPIFQK